MDGKMGSNQLVELRDIFFLVGFGGKVSELEDG
jgi:hypothetical protein